MGDWISQLRQVADQMRLDAKAKAKASSAVVAKQVADTVKVELGDDRPASPRMPGYPTNAAFKKVPTAASPKANNPRIGGSIQNAAQLATAASDVKKREETQTVKFPAHSAARNASTPAAGDYKKPSASLGKKFPTQSSTRSALVPAPLGTSGPPRGKSPLPQPLAAASKGKRAPEQGKAHFAPPNMAEYSICHGSAGASTDQSWQELGARSTFEPSQNRGKAQCTLGIDFGTAFTKACVQFRHSTFVVHWDLAVPNCIPFLLPSVFTVKPNEVCVLGTTSDGCLHEGLKMGLLSNRSAESERRATVFLALVTRYIRSWLFSQHRNVFGGFQLEWFMNVGLPAFQWDDSVLRNTYKKIAFEGWLLGVAKGPITIQSASSVLSKIQHGVDTQFDSRQSERFGVFPEFVAQINSYRKSPQRRRDLHLLVDIGAGTVDVVTFHVWESEGADCYSILEAAVEQLGTHVLLGYRAQAGEIKRGRWEESHARLSMSEFESKFGLSAGKLKSMQGFFVQQFHRVLDNVLRKTKSDRYEPSPAWKAGVPFFFCGGGKTIDAYREAIAKCKEGRILSEIQMPWPDGLQPGKLKKHDFHRVSVAHGLSDSADNIGKIERKSEVPDLRRSPMATKDYRSGYPEK